MTLRLTGFEVENFRSIRGKIEASLDADVVLVHGENGAGKTSLLSAIELALTGQIPSLRNADTGYQTQLLHRGTATGKVSVGAEGAGGVVQFQSMLTKKELEPGPKLDPADSAFFAERCYLPQSLLSQLLQIYQKSGSGLDSPLARFVGTLLGLGALDALEAGLSPVGDVRNIRRLAPDWGNRELERDRIQRLLAEHDNDRRRHVDALGEALKDLKKACDKLETGDEPSEERLPYIAQLVEAINVSEDQQRITERRRHLTAIMRQVEETGTGAGEQDATQLQHDARLAGDRVSVWQQQNGDFFAALRRDVEAAIPNQSFASSHHGFIRESVKALTTLGEQTKLRLANADSDARRTVEARDELEVVKRQIATIDAEISTVTSKSEGLAAILSELSGYILNELCPVCDRDFAELSNGTLSDHLHDKVARLSGAAERMLALGRSRSEQQQRSEALEREIEILESRRLERPVHASLVRQDSTNAALLQRLNAALSIAAEGDQLESANVLAQRNLGVHGTRDIALRAASETLTDFARNAGVTPISPTETVKDAAKRLDSALALQANSLDVRQNARKTALEALGRAQLAIRQRDEIIKEIEGARTSLNLAVGALQRGKALREQAQSIKASVDAVRSAIIRREFNDRLNHVWRDLFVRLAPSEPFVPAFSVPKSGTRRLQPKLVTLHRDGGQPGGTPGAMLSAGNLNTAALTLFLALHLSVPVQLPWLILDDPVQSMDDVHVAQFAALLRTLSKQHGRQTIVAVHDRQLFDYLRLELSPAKPDETLLTLELSRTQSQNTQCLPQWRLYREENRLNAA